MKNVKFVDVLVIGLALFAMFFGAGNLIFPPYLGTNAGKEWFIGFLCFFIADVGLALVAIMAMIQKGDVSMSGVTGKLGKTAATIINTAIVLCIGPFLAIPRTAAVTFEMGIQSQPVFSGVSTWIFGLVFFGITLALTIRPSAVVDVIGKFLTPILVICLLVTIVIGIVHPIGPIVETTDFATVKEGVMQGYQTMDVLASIVFVTIILSAAKEKGYTETKTTMSVVVGSSIVAAIGLFIIYGGLAYLGATTSAGGFEGLGQAQLVVAIVKSLIGNAGVWLLGIIVFFACLTTSIGLTSSVASYFRDLTNGKISYEKMVVITVVFSYIVSNFGLDKIISIAAPILSLLYPVILVMIILTYFHNQIHNDNIYIFAAVAALIVSALDILAGYPFGSAFLFIKKLPLADFQFSWIIPAVIAGIIGKFLPPIRKNN